MHIPGSYRKLAVPVDAALPNTKHPKPKVVTLAWPHLCVLPTRFGEGPIQAFSHDGGRQSATRQLLGVAMQVIESFRDFMNAVLTRGYRFKAR